MLISLVHILILSVLEFYPYPELFVYPYLTNQHFLPYAQILDQHFPGLLYFPINFFSLGFNNPNSFKWLLLGIVFVQSWWIYKISKSHLAVFTYAFWQPFFEGNQLWLDTFLGLFTLPAYYFAQKKKWLVTGLILGLAVVFKQTLVPLVAFVGLIILWQKDFSGLVKYSLAAVTPSLIMLCYFQHLGVVKDFWFWTIQFNLGAYAAAGKLAPTTAEIIKMLLPMVLIIYTFFKYPKSRLVIGWLVFSVIGGIARFGFIHLQPAISFFAIMVGMFSVANKKIVLGFFVLGSLLLGHFYLKQLPNLNKVHFFDPQTLAVVDFIKQETHPADKVFLLGIDPQVYAISQTLPPGQVFIFQFPWFLKIAQDRLLTALKTDPPKLIVFDPTSNMDGQYINSYAPKLIEYTKGHYQLIFQLGTVEFYENRF